jgi:uncharacterized RDD family membrane protein YckC
MFQSTKTNVLVIRTPEGIAFPLLLAGPITRFLAWFLDMSCIAAATFSVGIILNLIGMITGDIADAFRIIVYFVLSIGYPIFAEWRWRGQTIGKRLLRLRVMDVQGLRLQFSQVMLRNLLRFIDSLPVFYTVGGIACFLSKRAQRLGDIAANTIVVRDPRLSEPDLSQVMGGKYNSFRDYPHLAARLRHRLTVEEAGIGLQAILRRERLQPLARIELFGEIASHMKRIVEFPPDAVEGLTDEQYVRNVVDLLFERSVPRL